MPLIQEPLGLCAALALLVAVSELLAQRTFLRHIGSALLVIVLAALAANLRVIPVYEAGGFYDEDLAKKLVDNLFTVRNAVDPAEAYRAFRGRDARIEALMLDRGFPIPGMANAN